MFSTREGLMCYTLISCFHRAFFKVSHFYWPTNALNCVKLNRLKIYMYQYFKRQLKTPTRFGSFGIHPQGVLNVLH